MAKEIQDRPALAERLNQRALNETADAGGVKKDESERLVEEQTGVEVTKLQHPTDANRNDVNSLGAEIARGLVEGLKNTVGFGAPRGPSNRVDHGTTTGNRVTVKAGARVGYFPYRGGHGPSQGGWFLISESEKVVDSQMTRIAISQQETSYDEGRGILYHDLRRTDLQSWSEHIGVRFHSDAVAAI